MSDGLRRNTMLGSPSSSNSGGGGTSTSGSYTVNLNGQWELTTTPANPDSALYDGVYRSFSNYNVNNSAAIMYITIKDCSSFQVYIRSSSEANWDYIMISQLDQTINGNTTYSNTTLVKAHTYGNKQSGTALSNYTLVEYTGITPGEHTITVVYRKDSSSHSGDDRGYVLIPKSQSGGDSEEGGDEGPMDINNYLTIEALESGLTAKLSTNACEYCINGDGIWYTLAADTTTPSINQGQVISFRGNLTPNSSKGIGTFTISKKCNLKGNCMSMLFGNNAENNYSLSGKDYAFYRMFYNCDNIIEVSPNFLPATTLASYCYYYMFGNCSSLTITPELPAITLDRYCYYYMFSSCGSLTTAPELPATVLTYSCYSNMFSSCSSLTTAPELPATTLSDVCYQRMFSSCLSLTTAPELPATTLSNSCYVNMFSNCISLTTPPSILPSTTLVYGCYQGMFNNCQSLTTAPELPATNLGYSCYSTMFTDCISLIAAPELPATNLNYYSYLQMFSGCSKLNYIKAKFKTTPGDDYTRDWVSNVSSTGIFVKNAEATWNVTGIYGIPEGWTVIEEESTGNLIFRVEGHQYPFPVDPVNVTTWEEFVSTTGSVEFSILEDGSIYSNIMHNNLVYEGTSIFVNKYHTLINGYTYAIYQDTNPA